MTNAQVIRRALTYARDFDALIAHHTEDPNLVGEGVMNEGEFAARFGLERGAKGGRDRDARTRRAARGARRADAITPPRSPAPSRSNVLRRAKDSNPNITASVSINHLTLNEIDVGSYRTFCKLRATTARGSRSRRDG